MFSAPLLVWLMATAWATAAPASSSSRLLAPARSTIKRFLSTCNRSVRQCLISHSSMLSALRREPAAARDGLLETTIWCGYILRHEIAS